MNSELASSLTQFETRWKPGVVTLQGQSKEINDAIQIVVDAIRSAPPQETIDAMRAIPGNWSVHSWCSEGEHLVVVSLSNRDLPIWEQANATDFDIRIEAYQNDMSVRRLEIASCEDHKVELLRIMSNLALVAKLQAN